MLAINTMSITQEGYLQSLSYQLERLYGITSRAQAEDIQAEILRINQTVQTMAATHLNPIQPLISFQAALLSEQDSSNQEEKA